MNLPLSRKQPKYRFYATLLNSYDWYLKSDSHTAFQEFIDTINRVAMPDNEAANRGTAFNLLIDGIKSGIITECDPSGIYELNGFKFPFDIATECAEYVQHGIAQVRESGFIETGMGLIEVYGDIDYLNPQIEIVDLKTTKAWELGKYNLTWQHIVYPYCTHQKTGLEYTFTYLATDFKTVVKEQYIYNHLRDSPKLISMCAELAQFIETHRELITDKKIFALAA